MILLLYQICLTIVYRNSRSNNKLQTLHNLVVILILHAIPGAYQPPKEHKTRFHHNPNYVTCLNKLLRVSHTISIRHQLMRFYFPYMELITNEFGFRWHPTGSVSFILLCRLISSWPYRMLMQFNVKREQNSENWS